MKMLHNKIKKCIQLIFLNVTFLTMIGYLLLKSDSDTLLLLIQATQNRITLPDR